MHAESAASDSESRAFSLLKESQVFTEEEVLVARGVSGWQADGNDHTILGRELPAMLSHLGIYPDESDVEQLLSDLGASTDDSITFIEIVGVLSMLRES